MAKGQGNPQIEDGFTQIANELVEMLAMLHLAPNCWRVLMSIIRKTYGFHKKVDYIANYQICEATGLCKAVVSRCLRTLHEQKVIVRNGKKVGLQKNYTLWQKFAVSSTCEPGAGSHVGHLGSEVDNIVNTGKLAESSTELAISSTKVSNCAVAQKKKENIQNKIDGPLNSPQQPTPTEKENHLLTNIQTLKAWKLNYEEDFAWLKDFLGDFPSFSISHIKACRDYHSHKQTQHKGKWKNRLRQWMLHEQVPKQVSGVQIYGGKKEKWKPTPKSGKYLNGETGEIEDTSSL